MQLSKLYNVVLGMLPARLTVGDVLAARRTDRAHVFGCATTSRISSIADVMWQNKVNGVVIHDPRGEFMHGLVTRDDIVRAAALNIPMSANAPEIMTGMESVCFVYPDNDVRSCLSLMAEVKCHHLPVVESIGGQQGVAMPDAQPRVKPALRLRGVVTLDELLGLTREARDAAQATAGPSSADRHTLFRALTGDRERA